MTDESTVAETRQAVYDAMRGIRGQVAESARRRRGGELSFSWNSDDFDAALAAFEAAVRRDAVGKETTLELTVRGGKLVDAIHRDGAPR